MVCWTKRFLWCKSFFVFQFYWYVLTSNALPLLSFNEPKRGKNGFNNFCFYSMNFKEKITSYKMATIFSCRQQAFCNKLAICTRKFWGQMSELNKYQLQINILSLTNIHLIQNYRETSFWSLKHFYDNYCSCKIWSF